MSKPTVIGGFVSNIEAKPVETKKDDSKKIKELNKKIELLTKEVEELNLKNTTLEDEKAKLTKEVEELNLKLEEVTKTSDKENKK